VSTGLFWKVAVGLESAPTRPTFYAYASVSVTCSMFEYGIQVKESEVIRVVWLTATGRCVSYTIIVMYVVAVI
jgi:hypothetical protein